MQSGRFALPLRVSPSNTRLAGDWMSITGKPSTVFDEEPKEKLVWAIFALSPVVACTPGTGGASYVAGWIV